MRWSFSRSDYVFTNTYPCMVDFGKHGVRIGRCYRTGLPRHRWIAVIEFPPYEFLRENLPNIDNIQNFDKDFSTILIEFTEDDPRFTLILSDDPAVRV